jgi:hypothetical protein
LVRAAKWGLPTVVAGSKVGYKPEILKPRKRLPMDWEDQPATWKQIRYLRQHGYKPDRSLTKTSAAELIQSMGGEVPVSVAPPPALVSQLPKQDAYLLRAAIDQALRVLAGAEQETRLAAEQELAIAVSKRQLFWIDTCKDPTLMQGACGQVLEFYRKFGCAFEAPSHRQVEEILSALDSAIPLWDRHHPELFYRTLELNHPELIKRRWV